MSVPHKECFCKLVVYSSCQISRLCGASTAFQHIPLVAVTINTLGQFGILRWHSSDICATFIRPFCLTVQIAPNPVPLLTFRSYPRFFVYRSHTYKCHVLNFIHFSHLRCLLYTSTVDLPKVRQRQRTRHEVLWRVWCTAGSGFAADLSGMRL